LLDHSSYRDSELKIRHLLYAHRDSVFQAASQQEECGSIFWNITVSDVGVQGNLLLTEALFAQERVRVL
jgi:hypothetical protein